MSGTKPMWSPRMEPGSQRGWGGGCRESLGQCGPAAVTPCRWDSVLEGPDPAPRMGTLKKKKKKKTVPGLHRKTTTLPEPQVSGGRV